MEVFMKEKNYYSMSEEEIFQKFQTDQNGLSSKEVEKRIKKYGKNELPKKKPDSVFKIFLNELKDPIILLLIVAIIASLFVGEYVDACVIFVIIMVDLLLGTFQEKKANNTAEALSNLVREKVKVQRDGIEQLVDSTELVVGDLVYLESGDKIAADLRILESHNFTVDESILTGESLAVEKNCQILKKDKLPVTSQTNILFAGTSVSTGRAVAIVIKIGLDTEIGKIADTINRTKEEKSPLTIRVERFSKEITILIAFVSVFIAIVLFLKGIYWEEILLSVIALGVSAMPEGLPLALTMALTIASNKMAKHKVVAKKLYSVESLGSCTVIASDKTGTLTVNQQTAKKILLPNHNEYLVTGTGYKNDGTVNGENLSYAKEIALLGTLNNEAKFNKD
jgi:magnesium-transporting ATPase (P-type)